MRMGGRIRLFRRCASDYTEGSAYLLIKGAVSELFRRYVAQHVGHTLSAITVVAWSSRVEVLGCRSAALLIGGAQAFGTSGTRSSSLELLVSTVTERLRMIGD